MKRIKDVIDKYKSQLFALENVVGVGCGYKEVNGRKINEECIVILVENKLDQDQLDKNHIVPQTIEQHKTDVIEVGKVELLSSDKVRTTKLRPAQPGASIGHYKITAGTFGTVVKDKKTNEPLILSNNHVLANITDGRDGRAEKGDIILQPGSYDGGDDEQDVIGHLERFVPIHNEQASTCPLLRGLTRVLNGFGRLLNFPYQMEPMSAENKVDAAVAKPKSPDLIKTEIMGLGEIEGIAEPVVNMRVKKSGRTTGITESRIKAIGVTINVQLSDTESAVFTDQIVTDPFSMPGDSGSIVINDDNEVVGLLFAGSDKSTICNRIDNVLEALDITIEPN
ncbi:S1 family peptidase [Natroniella sulfidigena]|uniref:S1 family peptidase n=1 Tax=Natroniella sulfidigena TaxID=723921 RepID=UPI00200A1432|nr:S1 family peptidase [Natroniella sulfidigena]MCK8817075.1 S1 family peptidase [Natroniella sulfidigena]